MIKQILFKIVGVSIAIFILILMTGCPEEDEVICQVGPACVHGVIAATPPPCVCLCTDPWIGFLCDSCDQSQLNCTFGQSANLTTCACECDNVLTCENGGTWDADSCKCDCPPGFTGATCSDSASNKRIYFDIYEFDSVSGQYFLLDEIRLDTNPGSNWSITFNVNSAVLHYNSSNWQFQVNWSGGAPGLYDCLTGPYSTYLTQAGAVWGVVCLDGWFDVSSFDWQNEIIESTFDFKMFDFTSPYDTLWVTNGEGVWQ